MRYLMACSTYHGGQHYLVIDADSDDIAIRQANQHFHQTVADMIPKSTRIEKRNYV